MTTILRVVALLVALASIVLAGASGVRAADPTLGATIQSRVYIAEDRTIEVWNRSDVEALFTFEPTDGYTIEPASLVLEADEHTLVNVVGTGGDGAPVNVLVTSAAPVPEGDSRSFISLSATIYHARPFDPSPWIWGALWLAVVAITVAALLRRLRPWEYRVARRPR